MLRLPTSECSLEVLSFRLLIAPVSVCMRPRPPPHHTHTTTPSRLENYCLMGEALKSLAGRLPALQQHWQVGGGGCVWGVGLRRVAGWAGGWAGVFVGGGGAGGGWGGGFFF